MIAFAFLFILPLANVPFRTPGKTICWSDIRVQALKRKVSFLPRVFPYELRSWNSVLAIVPLFLLLVLILNPFCALEKSWFVKRNLPVGSIV